MSAAESKSATAAESSTTATTLRSRIYVLLAVLSIGGVTGRILAVNSVDKVGLENYLVQKEMAKLEQKSPPADAADRTGLEAEVRGRLRQQRPFLSANDRSRWATVRSLVEQGTFAIDDIVAQPGWDTIDMVKHKDRQGDAHLYSSKPPLLAVLMAGEYWVIHRLTGWTLGDRPYEIGRFMLITINVPCLVLYFVMLARLAERWGTTDWGRIFMFAAGAFGTFLTTFAVSINNHLIAAAGAAAALYAALRIWYDGERHWRTFAAAGFFAAFTFANELPALSLLAAITLALLYRSPRLTLAAYLPAALVVVAAMYGTNYLAHGSLREPYSHRSKTDPDDNWYRFTYERNGRSIESYWTHPAGIDKGEPSTGAYVLHTLVGHHGIFSLTPIWILSVAGLVFWWLKRPGRAVAVLIGLLSVACYAFYISLDAVDRNYGGMTSGLRWMFWFAPLWLLALLPVADRLSTTRIGRSFALILLAFSVLSASYPTWNPWTQPWIANWLLDHHWIAF